MHRSTDSVRIVIFDANKPDYFLVVTETDEPDNWKLPGGKFEEGKDEIESPQDAANRELGEEIGVSGKQIGLRAAATLVNDDGVSARYIFAGTTRPNQIRPSKEIAQAVWHTATTLPECKNRDHILSAVATAQNHLSGEAVTSA